MFSSLPLFTTLPAMPFRGSFMPSRSTLDSTADMTRCLRSRSSRKSVTRSAFTSFLALPTSTLSRAWLSSSLASIRPTSSSVWFVTRLWQMRWNCCALLSASAACRAIMLSRNASLPPNLRPAPEVYTCSTANVSPLGFLTGAQMRLARFANGPALSTSASYRGSALPSCASTTSPALHAAPVTPLWAGTRCSPSFAFCV
mmetsp:Transcript_23893/g.81483  ORF Transcript_23893/g.81483 Transcript_23893/m.81483 type:complete len:200 (-) Transcript_23893:226-825(-)